MATRNGSNCLRIVMDCNCRGRRRWAVQGHRGFAADCFQHEGQFGGPGAGNSKALGDKTGHAEGF